MEGETSSESPEGQEEAIARLIHAAALRLCPRCLHVPSNRDEVIFEPLGIARRDVELCAEDEAGTSLQSVRVLTLACTHCGYLIEHCLDYLDRGARPCTSDLSEGLGEDPTYDVLSEVARILERP